MRVGVIGFEGFVGSAFFDVFSEGGKHETLGIGRENYASLCGTEFDILINANGNSSKRLADSEPARDWEMNVDATRKFLIDFPCKRYVHLSTVEVYNDKSSQQKTREDVEIDASALSNYGKSKYAGELVAKKHPSHLILRLAGMVGSGMKKGPAYDILHGGKIYISENSRLHFMETREVALIARKLCEMGKWNQTYNVVGKGSVPLSEFALFAGVKLEKTGKEMLEFSVSCEKLSKIMHVPSSRETVEKFCKSFKKDEGKTKKS